ncbi:uncharacterized protein KQ657_002881 [Scheffersomyces spartinae]|uniref:histone acetyltransferase n=1 Tax=Scheffersomyces spartinae TaxID=45513 RepID=A0A9P7V5W0_9ASCO|nr:uncharacterized protein KQ657_002881 [Scheffersomyces spartinae]KAG7191745.1 hypothetical protein KQ657_002881 [Scheffersomyces spartinae]
MTNEGRRKKADEFYGMLEERNIDRVVFGNREFDTWYGNAAYFYGTEHSIPGYEYANKVANDPTFKRRKQQPQQLQQNLQQQSSSSHWISKLYVCNYCFKYTTNGSHMASHRDKCCYRVPRPTIGKMCYRDDDNHIVIRQIRGFKNPLFCQNLSLFGKLFLEDKSVFYNVDNFDFYVIYGRDEQDTETKTKTRRSRRKSARSTNNVDLVDLVPLGFFSKEVLSWETQVNLACICIFPIFQRRHLGSLLIEFLYELSKREYKQHISGPEYPLSPFGKVTYLRYWSKKLASILVNYSHSHSHSPKPNITLDELSELSCFRKEDILLTMDYMQLLTKDMESDIITLHLGNVEYWCKSIGWDPMSYRSLLNVDNLVI